MPEQPTGDQVLPTGFEEVEWGIVRFVPNLLLGEYINIGIIVYGSEQPPTIHLGDFHDRLKRNYCKLSVEEIDQEVQRFVDQVSELGRVAGTSRVFQDLTTSTVRKGVEKWEERILKELVP